MKSLVVAVLAAVVLAALAVVLADGRVALVAGNGTHARVLIPLDVAASLALTLDQDVLNYFDRRVTNSNGQIRDISRIINNLWVFCRTLAS